MKQAEVVVGAIYRAAVSGALARVEVVGTDERDFPNSRYPGRRSRFVVRNLATGNLLRRTAAALRPSRQDLAHNQDLLARRIKQLGIADQQAIRDAFGITNLPKPGDVICGECRRTKEEHEDDGSCRAD